MDERERREALAAFLRTRRARLQPADVGLPSRSRRRTAGLRREEVAELANIGVSWYTLLEQGHDVHPSRQVLESLALALKLTTAEEQHLFLLACQELPAKMLVEEVINNKNFKNVRKGMLPCVLRLFPIFTVNVSLLIRCFKISGDRALSRWSVWA